MTEERVEEIKFKVSEKNMNGFAQMLTDQQNEVQTLKERTAKNETELINLRTEILNLKQLVGFVSGRGMGSTVHPN